MPLCDAGYGFIRTKLDWALPENTISSFDAGEQLLSLLLTFAALIASATPCVEAFPVNGPLDYLSVASFEFKKAIALLDRSCCICLNCKS